jgi:hypothetical protein
LTNVTVDGVPVFVASAEMSMWGIGINQNIEAAAMDLYLSIRQYNNLELDAVPVKNRGEFREVDFEDFTTVMGGGIIRF